MVRHTCMVAHCSMCERVTQTKLKALRVKVLCSPSLCELHGKWVNKDVPLHLTIFRQAGNALGKFVSEVHLNCIVLCWEVFLILWPAHFYQSQQTKFKKKPLSKIQQISHRLQPPKLPSIWINSSWKQLQQKVSCTLNMHAASKQASNTWVKNK